MVNTRTTQQRFMVRKVAWAEGVSQAVKEVAKEAVSQTEGYEYDTTTKAFSHCPRRPRLVELLLGAANKRASWFRAI